MNIVLRWVPDPWPHGSEGRAWRLMYDDQEVAFVCPSHAGGFMAYDWNGGRTFRQPALRGAAEVLTRKVRTW